jgi:superfamily I DNA/RNA helicase
MSTWLVPRHELTSEQRRAIELPHTENQVIFGAPGSGKTLIILYRADELRRRFGSPDSRYRILVYTNVLKTYIRSALELLGLPEHTVTTYDDWCRMFYEEHISRRLPWNSKERRPDFKEIRHSVARFVAAYRISLPLYDFVLVDEGQDLDAECFRTLRRVARHITVCLDHKQQIFEGGSDEEYICAALGLSRGNLSLLDAYRCSPYVARVAAQLLEDPGEREQYLRQVRTEQTGRETPMLYYASDFEDEKRRLIEVIRQRLMMDQRIAVLFPLRRQVFGFAQSLVQAGIEVETQDNLDFSTSVPKLITIHSAKGLTFDSVFLPRLGVESFLRTSTKRIRSLLFVAITRASQWVYLSALQDSKLPLLDSLESLASQRILTIQKWSRVSPQPASSEPLSSADLDFL